jgi:hypothetical protein
MDKAFEGGDAVRRMKPGPKPKVAAIEAPTEAVSPAQAYAMRVWGGQSVDVPRAERIERCMNALKGQNLPTDGIFFPA